MNNFTSRNSDYLGANSAEMSLSAGAIQQMYNGDTSTKPMLQLIDIKKIAANSGTSSDRYRLIISDGIYFMQAMLATQLNFMVESGQVRFSTKNWHCDGSDHMLMHASNQAIPLKKNFAH